MKCLLILLCILVPLYAQEGRGKRDGSFLRDTLQLSEVQVQKLAELRREHSSETRVLKRELKQLRMELFQVYSDSEKVASISQKTGEVHATLTVKMAEHITEITTILTDEQFQKFIQLKNSHKKRKP